MEEEPGATGNIGPRDGKEFNLRKFTIALALAAATAAAPAYADNTLTNIESTDACTLAYAGAVACQGYYGGNIDNATVSFQQTALNELLTSPTAGVAIGGPAPVINWQSLVDNDRLYSAADLVGNSLNFGQTLYGYVILGAHFGNNSDTTNPPPNVSAFYVFNFGTSGADHITFNPNANGFSNAALYSVRPPVPEPATWAMMLLGFGGIGAAMRRSRRQKPLMQIA